LGEILGHPPQVRGGQVGHQIVHRWILPGAVTKSDELVIEIARGFRGDPWESVALSALAVLAVARHAALSARVDGVDALERWNRFVRGDRRQGPACGARSGRKREVAKGQRWRRHVLFKGVQGASRNLAFPWLWWCAAFTLRGPTR